MALACLGPWSHSAVLWCHKYCKFLWKTSWSSSIERRSSLLVWFCPGCGHAWCLEQLFSQLSFVFSSRFWSTVKPWSLHQSWIDALVFQWDHCQHQILCYTSCKSFYPWNCSWSSRCIPSLHLGTSLWGWSIYLSIIIDQMKCYLPYREVTRNQSLWVLQNGRVLLCWSW